MNKERLQKIKDEVDYHNKQSTRVLEGDGEYDGADGARNVRSVCRYCSELIEALEKIIPE